MPKKAIDQSATTPTPTTPPRRRPSSKKPKVVIRAQNGPSLTVPLGEALQQAALDWSRIVRNRLRWAAQADAREDQAVHSRALLKSLRLNLDRVDQLAVDAVVQVSIPFTDEDAGWEARIFPWEYVLSSAIRGSKALVVVRHLDRVGGRNASRQSKATPEPTLILESAPGTLRERFRFESERRLVASSLRGITCEVLADASPSQARKHIAEKSPGAIHLSGVDNHQGAKLLGVPDLRRDGYLMVDARGVPEQVRAEQLAELLTSAETPPHLVAFNFQNSAARIAAMAVAEGASAAIGFQDVVDDSLAELLFATFYSNWERLGWDTFRAFKETFLELQARPESLSGTGIVLWSANDVFAGSSVDRATEPQPFEVQSVAVDSGLSAGVSGATEPPLTAAANSQLGPTATGAAPQAAIPPDASVGTPADESPTPGVVSVVPVAPQIWVEQQVISRVNYSRLHNERSLFESFSIKKSTPDVIPDVQVEVTLYVGGDSFPYKMSLPLIDRTTDLKKRIRVPLTSSLLRGVRENTQSVIYVRVTRGQETLYQDTFPVSLIPIEEWINNSDDAIWLPSFVLPRDPGIEEIVHRALGLLRALDDKGSVGFEGYQVVNESRNDPYDRVDLQVQAIWSTLAFQYDLAYINPPPTYSPQAQRLRTPSEVLRSQSGTCIDLALLFAACLESIDIYPVIVLYDGHANVGYWRGETLHHAFKIVQSPEKPPAAAGTAGAGAAPAASAAPAGGAPGVGADQGETETREAPVVPWQLRRQSEERDPTLHELKTRIDRRELFILDATLLTTHDGFADARDLGKRSLESGDAGRVFRSLVDIMIARRNGITPLPMEPR